ncbi:hypothetical protein NliqN6_2976 [Naganishia liquefaciens]|uniref:Uncharacterized protein n=1 Tax=Naganishia liquefaciens TaxID=104408 RepID=A0A8H3YEK3_9TREE|nr:hypothetical protein NliqN6_2976 [Naganishia liquefaciens]
MRISFFAQSQQHIAALALRLETHTKGNITLIADPQGIQLELTQGGRPPICLPRIPLSVQTLPSRQTISLNRNDGIYELKLPLEPKAVGLDVLKVPMSAVELDARRVRRARCLRCRHVIWDVRTFESAHTLPTYNNGNTQPPLKIPRQETTIPPRGSYTFRALPSAHWHESSEAWLCHPSGEFTGKLQRWVEKGWWPRWRVGLVGERAVNVRVRPGREEEGAVEPSLTDWHPLTCPIPTCKASLGTRNIRFITSEEDAEDPLDFDAPNGAKGFGQRIAETWRLDKFAVQFIDKDDLEVSCHVDEILSTEMLECAQSLGIRKFRLAEEGTGLERLSLWLFNPDADIAWGSIEIDSATGDVIQNIRSGRFATILWQDSDSMHGTTATSERHEILSFPPSVIETIRATLQGDVDAVPSIPIRMGNWRTGYIRR